MGEIKEIKSVKDIEDFLLNIEDLISRRGLLTIIRENNQIGSKCLKSFISDIVFQVGYNLTKYVRESVAEEEYHLFEIKIMAKDIYNREEYKILEYEIKRVYKTGTTAIVKVKEVQTDRIESFIIIFK